MPSAYSTTKVFFLFLLVSVDASWGLSLESEYSSLNWTDIRIQILRSRYYKAISSRHGPMRDPKSRVKSNKLAHRDPVFYQDENVDIKWDMTNETDGSYSANVTISNHVMDHEFEQPWKLAFIWIKKETLLGTWGAEGTQHSFVSFGEGDADTYCLNNLTLWTYRDKLMVSVSHSNRGYRAQPPSDVTLTTTRGFEYEVECESMEQVTDVHLRIQEKEMKLQGSIAGKYLRGSHALRTEELPG
ncbi:hypothetical protein Bca4012_055416 [Brassica carinata]